MHHSSGLGLHRRGHTRAGPHQSRSDLRHHPALRCRSSRSEPWSSDVLKYRLAIEPIATRHLSFGRPRSILVADASSSAPEEKTMLTRLAQLCSAALFACAVAGLSPAAAVADEDGVVHVKSAYPIAETVARLKQ